MLKKILFFITILIFTNKYTYTVELQNLPWDNGEKKIFVSFHQKEIREVLSSFCNVNNCTLNIESNVNYLDKTINGNFTFNSLTEYLNYLSSRYNFSWFYYRGVLYISSTLYNSEVLTIPPEYLLKLKDNLVSIGLYNSKFGWIVNNQNSTVIISGPGEYVRLVHEFIQKFTPLPRGNDFIMVKLKYANANDITLNLSGQNYVIPGIATILTNLTNLYTIQQKQQGSGDNPQSGVLLKNMLTSYKSDPNVRNILGEISENRNLDSPTPDENSKSKVDAQYTLDSSPIIQADVRTNSIVIFDKQANLPMYQKLIKYLDVPQEMLQVNTTAIDLDEDKFNSGGVNWLANINGVQVGFNASSISNGYNTLGAQISPTQNLIPGVNINNFMANLNVLAQRGEAQILSTPSLVTLNDFPAIITFNAQLYYYQQNNVNTATENAGNVNNNSSPSQVNANSSIIIVPHLMPDSNKVRLEIFLQSQQVFDQDNTSSYPVIGGGTIQTQAVIGLGQGLVLGGYDQEKKQTFISKIPFLGDIPILGWLFKSKVTKIAHLKRMYLITVQLVDPNNMTTSPSDKSVLQKVESGIFNNHLNESVELDFSARGHIK